LEGSTDNILALSIINTLAYFYLPKNSQTKACLFVEIFLLNQTWLNFINCNIEIESILITAEITIVPVGGSSGTSVSKEVAAAFDAIRMIIAITAKLTPMGTQIEAANINKVLNGIAVAHEAVKSLGVMRIISLIHIDERLDKQVTLKDKVDSVLNKLK
jgi:uncharacterized protein (TIGR00106 family)